MCSDWKTGGKKLHVSNSCGVTAWKQKLICTQGKQFTAACESAERAALSRHPVLSGRGTASRMIFELGPEEWPSKQKLWGFIWSCMLFCDCFLSLSGHQNQGNIEIKSQVIWYQNCNVFLVKLFNCKGVIFLFALWVSSRCSICLLGQLLLISSNLKEARCHTWRQKFQVLWSQWCLLPRLTIRCSETSGRVPVSQRRLYSS